MKKEKNKNEYKTMKELKKKFGKEYDYVMYKLNMEAAAVLQLIYNYTTEKLIDLEHKEIDEEGMKVVLKKIKEMTGYYE